MILSLSFGFFVYFFKFCLFIKEDFEDKRHQKETCQEKHKSQLCLNQNKKIYEGMKDEEKKEKCIE